MKNQGLGDTSWTTKYGQYTQIFNLSVPKFFDSKVTNNTAILPPITQPRKLWTKKKEFGYMEGVVSSWEEDQFAVSQGVLRLDWGRQGALSSGLSWLACPVGLFSSLQFSMWPCPQAPLWWPSDHTTDCPKQRAQ